MKITLFLIFFTKLCFSWVPPKSFNSTYLEIEESILSATIRGHYKNAISELTKKNIEYILKDEENRIDPRFRITPYFKSAIKFWFSIYTQYGSNHVVIHDTNNLNLIYNVIDYSELYAHKGIHRFSKSNLKNQLTKEYIKRLKKIIKRISTLPARKLSKEEDDILNAIKTAYTKKELSQKGFYNKLINNIRTQTGQRNSITYGISSFENYKPFIYKYIDVFRLPKEIMAISFLESSFNLKAHSKVDAVGIWQFMPFIGNLFMPKKDTFTDYRRNPAISTLAAFHLLKENKLILRRWDLAVTAYNSGPKHLKRAAIKLKRKIKNASLGHILKNSKDPNIKFASKNFYSEFIALVHALAYKEKIFPIDGIKKSERGLKKDKINIYVSLCPFSPKKLFKKYKNKASLKFLNPQFKKEDHQYSRGSLIVSDYKLSTKKFYKVSDKIIKSRFPKNFQQYIKEKKCL